MIEVKEVSGTQAAEAAARYGFSAEGPVRVFELTEAGARGVGLARLTEAGVCIDEIEADDPALKDFLTRSVLFALSVLKGARVYATGRRPDLAEFGFKLGQNETHIESENIVFPVCHGRDA